MTSPRPPSSPSEGRLRAADPGTPPQLLLSLAPEWPDEVLSNPALPLLALEDPAAFFQVTARAKEEITERALREAIERAPAELRRRFAAACLERALDLWQRERPAHQLAAQELVALCCLEAESDGGEERRARGEELGRRVRVFGISTGDDLADAVGIAAVLLFSKGAENAAAGVAVASAQAARHGSVPDDRSRAWADERGWQLSRIERLLAHGITLRPPAARGA